MTTTQHGTNAHPELPPCPSCGLWAWTNNSTEIGHGIRCWYSCRTVGCNGRGLAVFQGLALAVLWSCPLDANGEYSLSDEAHAWLTASLRALRTADINACVHGDKLPSAIILPSPPETASCLAGWKTWHEVRSEWRSTMDITDIFAERVSALRQEAA